MEKQAQMFKLVRDWKTSGISMKQFANQHDIAYKSFAYWCRKLRITEKLLVFNQSNSQQHNNPTFVEITNKPTNVTANNRSVQIELELSSGLRIKIY
jgi:transposase-like protein